MNTPSISTLVRFNFWADGRVLAACAPLSADAFTRPVTPDPGWGSLRGILVHVLDTEYGWRSVLQAKDADHILTTADFPDVAALQARWQVEESAWLTYVDELNEQDLQQAAGRNPPGDLNVWQTIMHVVMHGIQHRSEAAYILTEHGHSPGELDFDLFLHEQL